VNRAWLRFIPRMLALITNPLAEGGED
jgi:hypothetical protein